MFGAVILAGLINEAGKFLFHGTMVIQSAVEGQGGGAIVGQISERRRLINALPRPEVSVGARQHRSQWERYRVDCQAADP
jgi:hypothetical protein